jgi:hypothetical protein
MRSVVLRRGTSSLILGQDYREYHPFLLRNNREMYTTECDTTLVKLGNVLMLIIFLAITINFWAVTSSLLSLKGSQSLIHNQWQSNHRGG